MRLTVTGEGRLARVLRDQLGAEVISHRQCLIEIPQREVIIHAGARVFGEKSIADPLPYVQDNITDLVIILEQARRMRGLRMFVYLSTHEVESLKTPYAATKLAAEALVRGWGNTYGFPYLIIRLPNIFVLDNRDKGYVGGLLMGTIAAPRDPDRQREWMDGEIFAYELDRYIRAALNGVSAPMSFRGVVYTDQEIAERVRAIKEGK